MVTFGLLVCVYNRSKYHEICYNMHILGLLRLQFSDISQISFVLQNCGILHHGCCSFSLDSSCVCGVIEEQKSMNIHSTKSRSLTFRWVCLCINLKTSCLIKIKKLVESLSSWLNWTFCSPKIWPSVQCCLSHSKRNFTWRVTHTAAAGESRKAEKYPNIKS